MIAINIVFSAEICSRHDTPLSRHEDLYNCTVHLQDSSKTMSKSAKSAWKEAFANKNVKFLLKCPCISQKSDIPRVPQCLSLRPNWDSPTPFPLSKCAPCPPGTQSGGGTHSCKGMGESQFRRLEKKISTLSNLWSIPEMREQSEPVLLNVYGAPELMPRNEFRQPM